MKKILLTLLLVSAVFAATCDKQVQEERWIDAGDCYRVNEEWGNCVYYYLKGAREAELKWDKGDGQWAQRSVALTYYSTTDPETYKCLSSYGDNTLKIQLGEYHQWMVNYPSTKADTPFDMQLLMLGLEQKLFNIGYEVNAEEEEPAPVVDVAPEEPKTEEPQADNTMLYVLGAVVVIVIVLVIVVAAFFLMKGKPKAEKPVYKKEEE